MSATLIALGLTELPGGSKAESRSSGKPQFQSAARVHQALTAAAEKRALVWMAQRAPAWLNSDHLTILGFVAQFLTGLSYALSAWNRWLLLAATACIALNWLGDSLDGTLARVRNRQRPRYGFYVDHVIDTFGAFFLTGGLALSGYTHPAIAMGMLIAFLMLSIETYLATYVFGSFHLSFWKFGPTEIRILLAIGNIALLSRPWVHLAGLHARLFDVGGTIAIAAMAIMLVISCVRHTVRLYREERIVGD